MTARVFQPTSKRSKPKEHRRCVGRGFVPALLVFRATSRRVARLPETAIGRTTTVWKTEPPRAPPPHRAKNARRAPGGESQPRRLRSGSRSWADRLKGGELPIAGLGQSTAISRQSTVGSRQSWHRSRDRRENSAPVFAGGQSVGLCRTRHEPPRPRRPPKTGM